MDSVWVRWIDNKVVLTRECECCGSKVVQVTDTKVYYSTVEKTVFYYIRKEFSDAIGNYRASWLKNCELDVFIPSLQVGIEVDVQHYHRNKNQEYYKDMLCTANNVQVIRLRDKKLELLNDSSTEIQFTHGYSVSLSKAIENCLQTLGVECAVDIDRDKEDITAWINENLLLDMKMNHTEWFKLYLCEECRELCFGKGNEYAR